MASFGARECAKEELIFGDLCLPSKEGGTKNLDFS